MGPIGDIEGGNFVLNEEISQKFADSNYVNGYISQNHIQCFGSATTMMGKSASHRVNMQKDRWQTRPQTIPHPISHLNGPVGLSR